MRLFLCSFLALLVTGCVSTVRDGVVVPTKFAGQFSIPRSEGPAGTPKAYLRSFDLGGQRLYACLLLWKNNTAATAGLFKFRPTSSQITLQSLAEVGHYRIVDKNQIQLEMFAASGERRYFFMSHGDYGRNIITIKAEQRRDVRDAKSIMDRYEYDPSLVISLHPTW